ncbi:MAG: PQQ-binding-like beta-propeller repeat protein, partial [bacterium]
MYITTDGASYSVSSDGCSISDHATDDHPWPMFRHDIQRTGRSGFLGPTSPYLKWSYRTVDDLDSSPAIDSEGGIYAGSKDDRLYAFSSTGALEWSYLTFGNILSSPAIDASGTVYVGSSDTMVYACSSIGSLAWSYRADENIDSSPLIDGNGRIYIGSD